MAIDAQQSIAPDVSTFLSTACAIDTADDHGTSTNTNISNFVKICVDSSQNFDWFRPQANVPVRW
jgi:hypothetical protein